MGTFTFNPGGGGGGGKTKACCGGTPRPIGSADDLLPVGIRPAERIIPDGTEKVSE